MDDTGQAPLFPCIDKDVRNRIEQSQKDHYIRERMSILKKELENNDEFFDDFSNIRLKAKNFEGPRYVKSRIDKELDRLDKLPPVSSESGVITSYVETLLSIPWNKESKNGKIDIKKAEKILEKEHFGLHKVKQRVLEYIAVLKLKKGNPGAQIICFAGPPGVGKTSIALSVAHALGRKFVRQALGGVKDEAEIRGHRRTYIGAMPGRIIKSFIKAGVKNPVILLDEIDKLGKDFRGDPASALLEVLDPEQNSHFIDNYIDLETDLSDVIFLATANDISLIPTTLRDRLEIIKIDGYTAFEKEHIARKYLLPKQKKRNGVSLPVRITKNGFFSLLYKHTEEAGVRELERIISTLCRKIAFDMLKNSDEKKAFTITAKTVSEYLGSPKYSHERCETDSEIGVVNGLAWTTAGGKLLKIEATRFPGDGSVKITGHLGEVMKESVSTAVSFVRSISSDMPGINMKVWRENDIHIHFPEGAVPKDGPSAGVAISLAIASVVSDTPVKSFVAVTGESTLRGHVLKIGGLKAKLMAAKNAGTKTVFIPEANKTELSEIPDEIKKGLEIKCVSRTSTVIKNALVFSGMKSIECKSHRKSAGIQ
ncbi:MAG: endopeptidase La [bacterium]